MKPALISWLAIAVMALALFYILSGRPAAAANWEVVSPLNSAQTYKAFKAEALAKGWKPVGRDEVHCGLKDPDCFAVWDTPAGEVEIELTYDRWVDEGGPLLVPLLVIAPTH